jgi:hypothetical protein
MRPEEPADYAARVERAGRLPDGAGERFAGYAVLGVSFESGDVLALRHYPVSSHGRAYTCVWHCSRDGEWVFYADVPPSHGCARYFAPALKEVVVAPIRVEWQGPRRLVVAADGGRLLCWSLELRSSMFTRLFNHVAPLLDRAWTRWLALLEAVPYVSRLFPSIGELRLTGRTPTGARFIGLPQAIWLVANSRATVQGVDLGSSTRLRRRLALGEFSIPRRGLFTMAHTVMRPQGR